MASGALFGGTAARSTSKNLVEFKAGKMTLKGKMVHPDKRKGLVYVYQSDDSLMHFCWKDRTKGTVEDDLIIFPDDIEFKHVPQCTTGRVYLLKFKSSSRKFFFWMQEPKTDKDEENRKKVNELLNNPPTPGSTSRGGSGGFSGIPPELASEGDLQSLLGNMNQQQLMQLLGGMGMSSMGGLSQLIGGRPGSAQSESNTVPECREQESRDPEIKDQEIKDQELKEHEIRDSVPQDDEKNSGLESQDPCSEQQICSFEFVDSDTVTIPAGLWKMLKGMANASGKTVDFIKEKKGLVGSDGRENDVQNGSCNAVETDCCVQSVIVENKSEIDEIIVPIDENTMRIEDEMEIDKDKQGNDGIDENGTGIDGIDQNQEKNLNENIRIDENNRRIGENSTIRGDQRGLRNGEKIEATVEFDYSENNPLEFSVVTIKTERQIFVIDKNGITQRDRPANEKDPEVIKNVKNEAQVATKTAPKATAPTKKSNRLKKLAFNCTACGKVFRKLSRLHAHFESMHRLFFQGYNCPESGCKMTFHPAHKHRMKLHLRNQHRYEPDEIERFLQGLTLKIVSHSKCDRRTVEAYAPKCLIKRLANSGKPRNDHKDSNNKPRKDLDNEVDKGLENEAHKHLDNEAQKDLDNKAHIDLDNETHKDLDEESHKDVDNEAHKDLDAEAHKDCDDEAHRNLDNEAQKYLEHGSQKDLDEESQKDLDDEPQSNQDNEAQKDLDNEAHKDLDGEAHKDCDVEAHRNLDDEAYKDLDKEPRKNLDNEAHRDLDDEAHKDLDDEAQRDLDKEPRNNLDKEPPKWTKSQMSHYRRNKRHRRKAARRRRKENKRNGAANDHNDIQIVAVNNHDFGNDVQIDDHDGGDIDDGGDVADDIDDPLDIPHHNNFANYEMLTILRSAMDELRCTNQMLNSTCATVIEKVKEFQNNTSKTHQEERLKWRRRKSYYEKEINDLEEENDELREKVDMLERRLERRKRCGPFVTGHPPSKRQKKK